MGRSFALPATLGSLRNYVDGEFVETGRTFDNVSPIDGSVLAKVHEADAALVDRAVRAARRALDEGPWGRTRVEQRAEALHRVADIIARRFDEFLQAEVADTGRPVEQARKLDVYRGIANGGKGENDRLGAYTNFALYHSKRAEPAFLTVLDDAQEMRSIKPGAVEWISTRQRRLRFILVLQTSRASVRASRLRDCWSS